jgi:hypothetical protein
MNLQQLLDYVNFLGSKDESGNVYPPERFNLNLPIAIREVYDAFIPFYEKDQKITEIMSTYKVVLGDDLTPHLPVSTRGKAVIPSDFDHHSSLSYPYIASYDSDSNPIIEYRDVDIVTEAQYQARVGSTLLEPTKYDPVATYYNGYIQFSPYNLISVRMVYLKKPEIPYYDYYIDTNLDHVYLAPGATHTLATGEEGSQGQTTGTVTSATVELSIHESTHPLIAYILLAKLGINIKDLPLVQYAEMLKR